MRPLSIRMPLAALAIAASILPAAPASNDLLLVLPLDTAAVIGAVDASTASLDPRRADRPARRGAPSPAALVAREAFPDFGAALERLARAGLTERRFEVIDSSASRMALADADADSARFRLVIDTLRVDLSRRTVPRRTVPPAPPGYDPTTGTMTPGTRRAVTEGPGRMTTLSLTASWRILDARPDSSGAPFSLLARGQARGSAAFRGNAADARGEDWSAAARALALDLTHMPPFTTPKARP